MSKYAMIFDKKRCIGCNACVVSCQQNYNMPPANKLNWVQVEEEGTFPEINLEFTPMLCGQCDNPVCVDVCPVKGATFKTKEGYVLMVEEECIGCRKCVEACPFGARSMSEDTGKAVKCIFCAEIVEHGGKTVCSNTCPTDARIFGDTEDPDSDVAKLIESGEAKRFKVMVGDKELGQNFYYIKEK